MKPLLKKAVQCVLWTALVIALLFVGLVIYRVPLVLEKEKTAESVAVIHAQKISIDDVMGEHIPPQPDPILNDETIAGIDANGNSIRDDVELAIFSKYPNSPRIRAAELQYALAEQMFLTKVFNKETWKAVAEEVDRAYQCVGDTYPRTNLQEFMRITDARSDEVKNWILNTTLRKDAYETAASFITSFGLENFEVCDINLDTL